MNSESFARVCRSPSKAITAVTMQKSPMIFSDGIHRHWRAESLDLSSPRYLTRFGERAVSTLATVKRDVTLQMLVGQDGQMTQFDNTIVEPLSKRRMIRYCES